ncbi:MAG: hypothetical protein RLY93_12240 [Sumerlaeia bacterium]
MKSALALSLPVSAVMLAGLTHSVGEASPDSRVIYVSKNTGAASSPSHFTTIQGAIDSVDDAEATSPVSILIYPGTYEEYVTVETSHILLQGISKDAVTVKAPASGSSPTLYIALESGESLLDTLVEGLTITASGSGLAAVAISGVNGTTSAEADAIIEESLLASMNGPALTITDSQGVLIRNVVLSGTGSVVSATGEFILDGCSLTLAGSGDEVISSSELFTVRRSLLQASGTTAAAVETSTTGTLEFVAIGENLTRALAAASTGTLVSGYSFASVTGFDWTGVTFLAGGDGGGLSEVPDPLEVDDLTVSVSATIDGALLSPGSGSESFKGGAGAAASGIYDIAIGKDSSASGTWGVAIGKAAQATDTGAVSIGSGANSGYRAIAIGAGSPVAASEAVAIGYDSVADQTSAVAIGDLASATGWGAVAIGVDSSAVGSSGVAVGHGSGVGSSAVSIGDDSSALPQHAVALGGDAVASDRGSIAIGKWSTASGSESIAFGKSALATFTNAMALGYLAEATSWDAVALVSDSEASGQQSMALGYSSRATAKDAVSLGTNAEALFSKSVAVGTSATTTRSAQIMLGASDYSVAIPKVIEFLDPGTSNTAGLTDPNAALLFAKTGDLWVQAGDGSQTQLSTHYDPRDIDGNAATSFDDPTIDVPWSLHHTNVYIGKGAVVDMAKMVAWVEAVMQADLGASAGKLVYEYDLPASEIRSETDYEVAYWAEAVRNADWIEVALENGTHIPASAFESVEIMDVVEVPATRYEIDTATRAVVAVETTEPVEIGTGEYELRLRSDYKFEDGKLYRRPTPEDLGFEGGTQSFGLYSGSSSGKAVAAPTADLPEWIADRVAP